jgi:hypothetical protein
MSASPPPRTPSGMDSALVARGRWQEIKHSAAAGDRQRTAVRPCRHHPSSPDRLGEQVTGSITTCWRLKSCASSHADEPGGRPAGRRIKSRSCWAGRAAGPGASRRPAATPPPSGVGGRSLAIRKNHPTRIHRDHRPKVCLVGSAVVIDRRLSRARSGYSACISRRFSGTIGAFGARLERRSGVWPERRPPPLTLCCSARAP